MFGIPVSQVALAFRRLSRYWSQDGYTAHLEAGEKMLNLYGGRILNDSFENESVLKVNALFF